MSIFQESELVSLMADFLESVYLESISEKMPLFNTKSEYKQHLKNKAKEYLRKKAKQIKESDDEQ